MLSILMRINTFFDFFYWGSAKPSKYIFIIMLSFLSAFIFLYIFKKTSNQVKIKNHKNKIWGNILQIRLYKDRFVLIILSMLNIIKYNVLYIKETLIPLVFIFIPMVILIMQVNNHCGYEPFRVNQNFIVEAILDVNNVPDISNHVKNILKKVRCITSPGIILETEPLRIEEDNEVYWRAKILENPQSDAQFIRFTVQGTENEVKKQVVISHKMKCFSSKSVKWSLSEGLAHNAEEFLPNDSAFKSVVFNYPRAEYYFFFWKVDALILYFILTIILSFALKPIMKVNF